MVAEGAALCLLRPEGATLSFAVCAVPISAVGFFMCGILSCVCRAYLSRGFFHLGFGFLMF